MSTVRNRSRYKTNNRITSEVRHSNGAVGPVSTSTFTEFEQMVDYNTFLWPVSNANTDEIKSEQLFIPTRLGDKRYPRKETFSSVSPVNMLTYSCVTVAETVGTIKFLHVGPVPFVTVYGNTYQALRSSQGLGPFAGPAITLQPTLPTNSQVLGALQTDIVTKARDPAFAFGETVGEFGLSLTKLRNPIYAINRIGKKFSGGWKSISANFRTTRQRAKGFSNYYLKYQYQLAPLVRDAQDAVDAHVAVMTGKSQENIRRLSRGKVLEQAGSGIRTNIGGTFPGQFPSIRGDHEQRRYRRVDIRTGCHVVLPSEPSLADWLGLSARHLPVTVWELFPYSFLIDRLVNVKRFIQTSTQWLGGDYKLVAGWQSVRVTDSTVSRYTSIRNASANRFAEPPTTPPSTTTNFSFTRDPWSPGVTQRAILQQGSGLLASFSSTAELVALTISRFSK